MPFDPNDLPDLSSSTGSDNNVLAELLRQKLKGQFGPIDYSIGAKKAELEAPFGNAMARAMFEYDGDRKFEVSSPFLGGNMNFSINDPNNERARFFLNYRRQF